MAGDQQEAVIEEGGFDALVPDGQVQPPPLPRATRKRLTALRADVATRLGTLAPRSAEPAVAPAPLAPGFTGREMLRLVREHCLDGDARSLADAKAMAAAAAGRARDVRLDELAWLGRGLVALHDASSHDEHLDAAERLAAAIRRLEVPRGGFRQRPDADPLAFDVAANGVAVRFLVELSWRIGTRGGHRDAAEKAVRRLGTPAALDAAGDGFDHLLHGIDALLCDPLHATVVGAWENPGVARLHRACLRLTDDPLVVDWRRAGIDFPDVGAPAVYLCRGSRCASPVTDEALLAAAVVRLA